MPRTLTEDMSGRLAQLLYLMKVPREMRLDILRAIETREELRYFLDILSERDYEMTPEEVYEASVDAVEAFQTA